jgi:Flp pilus assembly pilin Flp
MHSLSKYASGQGMTEYIIVVALIAIAAIGVYASFGDVVKNQTAAVAKELSGESGENAGDMARLRSEKAALRAKNETTLKGFSNN